MVKMNTIALATAIHIHSCHCPITSSEAVAMVAIWSESSADTGAPEAFAASNSATVGSLWMSVVKEETTCGTKRNDNVTTILNTHAQIAIPLATRLGL
ncbi:hypothetical protein BKP42_67000 [Rhodococcus erythropolis]|nr:hypothetical protein BKP42_67000 [Rhodococcus erythropolis]